MERDEDFVWLDIYPAFLSNIILSHSILLSQSCEGGEAEADPRAPSQRRSWMIGMFFVVVVIFATGSSPFDFPQENAHVEKFSALCTKNLQIPFLWSSPSDRTLRD